MRRTDIRRKCPRAPVHHLCRQIEFLLRARRDLAFPQLQHPLQTVGHDREYGLVDRRRVPLSDGVPNPAVACLSGSAVRPCGLDHLISDLAGNLEHEVEEQEGDVRIECRLRRRLGRMYEREELPEEGRPLIEVSGEEEEGEGMRELVADDCNRL